MKVTRGPKYEWEKYKDFIELRYIRQSCTLQELRDELALLEPPFTPSTRALKRHLRKWNFVKYSTRRRQRSQSETLQTPIQRHAGTRVQHEGLPFQHEETPIQHVGDVEMDENQIDSSRLTHVLPALSHHSSAIVPEDSEQRAIARMADSRRVYTTNPEAIHEGLNDTTDTIRHDGACNDAQETGDSIPASSSLDHFDERDETIIKARVQISITIPQDIRGSEILRTAFVALHLAMEFGNSRDWNQRSKGSRDWNHGSRRMDLELPRKTDELIALVEDAENPVWLEYLRNNSHLPHIAQQRLRNWLQTMLDYGGPYVSQNNIKRIRRAFTTLAQCWTANGISTNFRLFVDLMHKGQVTTGSHTADSRRRRDFTNLYHKFVLDPELESYTPQRSFGEMVHNLRLALCQARFGVTATTWQMAMGSNDFWNECSRLDSTIKDEIVDLTRWFNYFVGFYLEIEVHSRSETFSFDVHRLRKFHDRQFRDFWPVGSGAGSVATGLYLYFWMWITIKEFSYTELKKVRVWIFISLLKVAQNIANLAGIPGPRTNIYETDFMGHSTIEYSGIFSLQPRTVQDIAPGTAHSYLTEFARILVAEVNGGTLSGCDFLETLRFKKNLQEFCSRIGFPLDGDAAS